MFRSGTGRLRAAMEWSYRLLTPELRRFFARLSVFRGGWTLAAAEAVCCADADEEEGVSAAHSALEHLTQLRERSLVTAEETAPGGRPEMRFRLLETLREYGAEQLPAPEHAALERRHRDYYLRLAEETERKIEGPDQAQWLDRLEIEHDNLRAALDRCCPGAPDGGEEKTGHGEDAEAGLRLAGALWGFWRVRGHWREGRERLMACLRRAPAAARTGARAKALYAVGSLSGLLGDYTAARALCEESLAIAREREDGKSAGDALHTLGILVLEQGDVPAARAFLEESLTLRRAAGDRAGMAASLLAQGDLVLGNMPSLASALYQESLALRRALGDQQGIAGALNNLGEAARYGGKTRRRARFMRRAWRSAARSGTSGAHPSRWAIWP
jgi:tetratricopeptide (TPR) repeat protein